jgi:hypothetical protein
MAARKLFESGKIFGNVPWYSSILANDSIIGNGGNDNKLHFIFVPNDKINRDAGVTSHFTYGPH